jgi:hypothetical protein
MVKGWNSMPNLDGREHRLLDLSKVRDSRFKGAGIYVSEDNSARCTAIFSEWIASANTAHGGTSPFPYGLYILQGDLTTLADPPEVLKEGPFLEVIPCDRADRRAVRLNWNEGGTEAKFGFAPLAAALGIDAPKATTLWIEAIAVKGKDGKPIMALPVGDKIQRQAVQETAASKPAGTEGQE